MKGPSNTAGEHKPTTKPPGIPNIFTEDLIQTSEETLAKSMMNTVTNTEEADSMLLKSQTKINWGERRATLVSSPDKPLQVMLNIEDADSSPQIVKFDL